MAIFKNIDLTNTPEVYGLTFFNNKIGYKHIPKIASTSLKKAFYFTENNTPLEKVHVYYRTKFVSIEQCSFKFIVIRDPIKRFISAYFNRVHQFKQLRKKSLQKREPEFLEKYPDCRFTPNIHYYIKHFDMYRQIDAIKEHTDSIYDLILGKIDLFDQIYPIENINKLKIDIENIIEKPFKIPKENTSNLVQNVFLKDLTKSEIDFLLNLYKDDYLVFKEFYNIDDIWKEWKNGS
jgi:hypothetical protein